MPQLYQQMACPARMGANLHSYPAGLKSGELTLEGSFCGGQTRFFDHFTILIDDRD
jgi:hypothetical protein